MALTAEDTGAPPKDHALFVGRTLLVEAKGAARDVVGAEGRNLMVDMDGVIRPISKQDAEKLRVDIGLKLSNTIALVKDFSATPTKTIDRGTIDWMRQTILMQGLQSDSIQRANQAAQKIGMYSSGPSSSNGFGELAAKVAQMQETENLASFSAQEFSAGAYRTAMQLNPSETGADALEVSCSVASPKPAKNAFLLLVSEYQMPDLKDLQYRVHTEEIPELGPRERRVQFVQKGFPAGYQLLKASLHVYADGLEVATNLSERRVDLTADDALRYLTLCYIGSHPKETLAAVPQRVAVPASFKQRVSPAQLDQRIYATVGMDGGIKKAAADELGATPLDPYLEDVVKRFRFNPALKEGKPVESQVAFKLSDYVR